MSSTVIIGEVGINHNGDLDTALRLCDAVKASGADYAKFQKRDVELAVPRDQWDKPKETPWGTMPYIDYKRKMEFGKTEFDIIDTYCKSIGLGWFGSAWDVPSAEFLMQYEPDYIKVPSAKVLDWHLLHYMRKVVSVQNKTEIVVSTGMCSMEDIDRVVAALGPIYPIIMHCTSTYPCPPEEVNLRVIPALRKRYPYRVGFSDHHVGLVSSVAAVALGAEFIERHITLDRASWGTDQSSSTEPQGFVKLVEYIRSVETLMGDGNKRVENGELEPLRRLRG